MTDDRLREIESEPWSLVNAAPLASEVLRLRAENEALRKALAWYVDNDDTNEGGRWEKYNARWLEGKRAAEKLLGRAGGEP